MIGFNKSPSEPLAKCSRILDVSNNRNIVRISRCVRSVRLGRILRRVLNTTYALDVAVAGLAILFPILCADDVYGVGQLINLVKYRRLQRSRRSGICIAIDVFARSVLLVEVAVGNNEPRAICQCES